MERRIVITGIGWITPLGHDIESVWRRMLNSESGVSPTEIFDASAFPTSFSAQVKDFDLRRFLGADAERHKGASRNSQFALAAASQAWTSAKLDSNQVDSSRVGVYLGGGEGPLDFDRFAAAALAGCRTEKGEIAPLDSVRWANTALESLSAINELEQEPNLAGGHLACQFQAEGPNINTLTACAASTQAMGEAYRLIQYGDADVMITGGTHSMIHPLGVTGFSRLTALSTRNDSIMTASRPFDRTRDGFVLGEGSGILILEEFEHARQRGAPMLAEITGFGSTADAFRITDIHEDGRGAIAAMRGALDSAGLQPGEIDYISAHGTGTEENDKIETLAIRKLYGENAKKVAISSVKSMVGHLIAAAGAVELITCVLAIRDGVVPPTINYQNPDPNCDLDYVPNAARKMPVRICLSNSFGFGGQNDTLIVRAIA
ncbi:MAG: beta-ketoacyl-[acyl-carrier-protein] synthase II [Planctomycetes bacterium]|nr:beta-ketoacyl-[acyl-carrier-protein] synthase II [Planctomycetota bacterium]MBI3835573.1 beta-ketoacyl-[acyl-carrier-protein] synthase II [Planctomycetota bacterium]